MPHPKINAHDLLTLLSDITQAVQSGEETGDVLNRIASGILRTFSARGVTLRTLDPMESELKLEAAAGLSQAYLEKGPVVADRSLSEIYDAGPVIIRDVQLDPRVQYPEAATAEGIHAIVALPFEIMDNHRMVLRIYFESGVTLDGETLEVMQLLAGQGAIAIRNTLLQNRYLKTFRRISSAIHSENDTQRILQSIVQEITEVMRAMGCIYWIVNPSARHIESKVSFGFKYRSLTMADYDAIETMFEPVKSCAVRIEQAQTDPRIPDLERLGKRRVRSIMGIPFPIAEPYVGILAVYFSGHRRINRREEDFLAALGEQAAISLHRALRYDENRLATFRQMMEGLVLVIEAKDPITHGHSLKVGHYARLLAETMGLPAAMAEKLYHAGLLHDIGKIGMDDRVLSRLGKLKIKDLDQVRTHPVIGANILKPLAFLDDIVPFVLHHHERYDGSGYPDGLKGEAIPLGARILAACDAMETMISGRPCMPKLPLHLALLRLEEGRGTQFDPLVADALIQVVKSRPEAIIPLETPESYWKRFSARNREPQPFTDAEPAQNAFLFNPLF